MEESQQKTTTTLEFGRKNGPTKDEDNRLIVIRDLRTEIETGKGIVHAVEGVNLEIARGEIVGLVGESGSGKTMTALSVLRLLPEPYARIAGGSVIFGGKDLTKLAESEMRKVRGAKISIVFQDPMAALNPIMTIGDQLTEAIRAHSSISKSDAIQEAVQLLHLVGISDTRVRLRQYPFQISGGMRQRVMIAIALAGKPQLLIADEPTTNLDVSIQAQILELLKSIRDKTGTSVLLITHNLGIVSWLCDRVAVMYAGEIVESGTAEAVLASPKHPYTQLLIKAIPQVSSQKMGLESIPGDVPNLINRAKGCSFSPRCPYSMKICKEVHPSLVKAGPDSQVARCLLYDTNFSDQSKKTVEEGIVSEQHS
jgi:oligopeptide/dipeptide ABC transporter ATP-binding protein